MKLYKKKEKEIYVMTIKKEILDELIKDYRNPEDLLGENGLLKQLTKQLLERPMESRANTSTWIL